MSLHRPEFGIIGSEFGKINGRAGSRCGHGCSLLMGNENLHSARHLLTPISWQRRHSSEVLLLMSLSKGEKGLEGGLLDGADRRGDQVDQGGEDDGHRPTMLAHGAL